MVGEKEFLNAEETEDAEDTEGLVFKLKREIRLSRILSTEKTEESEVIVTGSFLSCF